MFDEACDVPKIYATIISLAYEINYVVAGDRHPALFELIMDQSLLLLRSFASRRARPTKLTRLETGIKARHSGHISLTANVSPIGEGFVKGVRLVSHVIGPSFCVRDHSTYPSLVGLSFRQQVDAELASFGNV